MPEIEWSTHAHTFIKLINLKKECSYSCSQLSNSEIYHGIADFSADSLALAVEASKTSAKIIVMAGVHFMAETAS